MNARIMWRTLLSLFFVLKFNEGIANDCVPYRVDNEVVACICNATYCDGLPDDIPDVPEKGSSYMFVSNKEGLRMNLTTVKFDSSGSGYTSNEVLKVDSSRMYQKVLGFGGAFTDATGINLAKLSQPTQDQLLRAYYDPKRGSRYIFTRVPIAASDFSLRHYSYDEVVNDTSLQHFALAKEDHDYKIPYLNKARKLNPDTLFIAAAWSAPSWMKITDGRSSALKEEYYQTYADYLVKFLDEYEKNDLDMWAISTGNEPVTGAYFLNSTFASMIWTPEDVAEWTAKNLGPALAASSHKDTLVLTFDDYEELARQFIEPTMYSRKSEQYVPGIALHWSTDVDTSASSLDDIRDNFPMKFTIMTQASPGRHIWNTKELKMESWLRAEEYILNIIKYMNHWAIGWIDSNLALDEFGGPNWLKDYGDSPIIVNPETDEFYKQPIYYALKHCSRFVDSGSNRIFITDTDAIKSTAFVSGSGKIVVILYNTDNVTRNVTLEDAQRGTLGLGLSPKSINTLTYE